MPGVVARRFEGSLAEQLARPRRDGVTLYWLGQAGFVIDTPGLRIVIDPYLSNSLETKYHGTVFPHLRMAPAPLTPDELGNVDLVLCTHHHTDHLDGETLVPLARANPGLRLYLPHPVIPEAKKRLGEAEVKLCAHGDQDLHVEGDWRIEGTVAKHNEVVRDEHQNSLCIGYLVQCGPFRIYHSGDTLWHDDIVQKARDFGPIDIAFLPINGNKPERRVAGNLNGTEAAALAKAIRARVVVPCHYDMFEFNTVTPDEFVTTCEKLGQSCRVLRCGEKLVLTAGG